MFGNVLKHGALAFTFAAFVTACGGGGGDPSVPDNLPVDDVTAVLTFAVIDPDTSSSTNILNTAEGNSINITLVDGNGAALASEFVTVSSTVGTISPAGGRILTDASGTTSATISSSGIDAGTAGVITVSFNNAELGASDVETLNVQVGSTVTGGGGGSGSVVALSAVLFDQREYELDPTDATGATSASEIDRINIVQPATLEALLLLDGAPVDNAIVSVSTNLGVLNPTSGDIITNELGIATIDLSVGNATSGEAGTISISAAGESESISFGVGSATLQLGTGTGAGFVLSALDITDTTLSASGNTGVSVNVVDENDVIFTTPIDISFTSGCVSSGDSSIDSPVTTVGGSATASYSVLGCENTDTITAEIVGVAGPSANGSVTIIASIPNSIAFTGANPENIALKGTGGDGRVENSDVTFQIIDNTGAPEAGVIVNFSLTTTTGGITLVDDTAQSNAAGTVTAKVSSGNIPTPVRVIATISLDAAGNSVSDANSDGIDDNDAAVTVTETISTVSDVLVVSTGLPDKNSFTIARSISNPGGGDTVGTESVISVFAADKFNNPVPDGTAITFTTEFGAIDPSCTTADGACNVTWRSQNPRAHLNYTADDIEDVDCITTSNGTTRNIPCREDLNFATPHGAFGSIVAYALGEETFIDANGNGLFDSGEQFDDLPEVFLDHNDDGDFGNAITVGSCDDAAFNDCTFTEGDDEETFIDFNSDGQYNRGDGIYNGSLCSNAAEAAGDCNTNLLNVSASTTLVLSSQFPFFALYQVNDNLDGSDRLLTDTTINLTPEEFVDTNANDQFDAGETFTDRNGNSKYDFGGSVSLELDISDHFNGPLPDGTTINVSATNCNIDTVTGFEFDSVNDEFVAGVDVPEKRFETIRIDLSEDTTTDTVSGAVSIVVSTPVTNNLTGVVSSREFTCIDAN